MDTVESLQSQMQQIQSQMPGYGADLPGEIQTQLQNAYSPVLQQSLQDTRDLMGEYLGKYYDVTQMGPGMAGTTAKDLAPTQKLGVMGRELGYMAGDLQSSQRLADYLGGQMSDAYNRAMQAAQMGQQSLADQYSRLAQQHQMAWQQAEAEKDRALQRELASRSGGGGTVVNYNLGEGAPTPQTADPAAAFAQKVAYIRSLRFAPDRPSGFDINAYHTALKTEADTLRLNIGDEELWLALGNTPKQQTSYTNPASRYFDLTKL